MAEEPREAPYTKIASQSRRYLKSPGNRLGVSQRQAMLEWGLTHERELWELELAGRLVGIHVGNRVWYSRAQLVALFGEPSNSPNRPVKMRKSDRGGYTQGLLFDPGRIPEAA